MLYRAKVSFSGSISMAKGEQRELSDKSIIKDLSEAGYIEQVEKTTKAKK